MATPAPKPSAPSSLLAQYKAGASLSLQQQTQATAGMTSAEKYAIARVRGDAITSARATATPTVTPTPSSTVAPTSTASPTPTPSTTSGSGGYGADLGGAYASSGSSNSTVPMNVNGKVVQVPIAQAMQLGQGGSPGLKTVIDALRAKGQIGKNTNNLAIISKAWDATVGAAMRNHQDPFEYLNNLPAPVESGSSKGDGTTTYVTDYSGSKGQSAFQSAFSNVFGRNPVAGDLTSPLKDAQGKPISWIDALNNEAHKPGNAETVTRSGKGTYVVTKGGFDAQAWMQGQLADYYRKGIQTGTLQPEQNVQTQYQQLAGDYGINVYDPSNKGFTTAAKLDLANLESKTTTLDTLKKSFADATLAKYGNLAPQLVQGGLTLKQIAHPALQSIQNILGIDGNNVTLDDPLVQKYLAGDGKSVMPQYQYEQLLRSDPRWNTSKDAQDNLSATAMSLAKMFGVMG